jgi:hypothetical protein
MSTCPECAAAAAGPHGTFNFACAGCRARHLSRSVAFSESMRTKRQTVGYRHALAADGVTHDHVKAAWEADAINRRPKP